MSTTPPGIDLRSDILAPATPEMLAAMSGASVGVAMWSEDTSVERLEALGAEMLGTEACLFLPNVTTANLLALMVCAQRGSAVLLDRISHIHEVEWYPLTAIVGATPRTIESVEGHLDPEEVAAAFASTRGGRAPHISLLILENSHTFAGGICVTGDETQRLAGVAHASGALVHLDGARLFNAAVALGVPASALSVDVDTVSVSLGKGLCAPGGALLAGRAPLVAAAREIGLHLGSGRMHKMGYLAAAGIIALETMVDRLADDHRRALDLARAMADIDGVEVEPRLVQTNLVLAQLDTRHGTSEQVSDRLRDRGLGLMAYPDGRLRAVTHRGIDDAAVDAAVRILRDTLA